MKKNFTDQIKKLVGLLIKNEETIAYLYEKYSLRFPGCSLWADLTREELAHADIIRKLFASTDFTKVSIDLRVVSPDKIRKEIKKIANQATSKKRLNLAQALTIAYKLECGLAESGYFKIFYSSDPEMKKVFGYLQIAAERHSRKIFEELKKV